MRLFVGIEFPPAVVAALTECQGELRQRAERGRFKRQENFHLTLQFLGEVPADRVGNLNQALKEVRSAGSFTLSLGKMGQFGQGDPVRVVWIDVAGDTGRLKQLQEQIQQTLANIGFLPERRPWRPHITLAQNVTFAGKQPAWGEYSVDPTPFTVTEFNLILSEEIERRRIYTPIHRFPL